MFLRIFLLSLVVVLICVGNVRGEDTFPVATLNLDRLFKNYKMLQDGLTPLKEAAMELDKRVQIRTIELETMGNELRRAQPGSPEFQRLQQRFAKAQNDLQQFVGEERGVIQKKEAALYRDAYKRMQEEVGKYCKAKGIKLVLREPETSLDDNQPVGEILKAVNSSIIYDEGLDITDEILKAMEEAEKPANSEAK